jgi:hypothetical protein
MIGFVADDLDGTSAALARELLRARPELARFSRSESAPGGGRYFVLEFPSPSGEHAPLVVDCGDRGRVAVRLGRVSIEFDAPPDGGRSSELPAAVALIEDFLEGSVRLHEATAQGRFAGCGVLTHARDLGALLRRLPRGSEVNVYTWDRTPAFYVASGPAT